MTEDITVYKAFSDKDKYYGFHWGTIDEKHVHIYCFSTKKWVDRMHVEHFCEIMRKPLEESMFCKGEEVADWSESTMLDVLVVTGWVEMDVLKAILDNVPDGWEKLQRNLYIAENVDKGEEVLNDLEAPDEYSAMVRDCIVRKSKWQQEQEYAKAVQDDNLPHNRSGKGV